MRPFGLMFFFVLLIFLSIAAPKEALAINEENLTMETGLPSPSGDYHTLRITSTARLAQSQESTVVIGGNQADAVGVSEKLYVIGNVRVSEKILSTNAAGFQVPESASDNLGAHQDDSLWLKVN